MRAGASVSVHLYMNTFGELIIHNQAQVLHEVAHIFNRKGLEVHL
jgi:hypothetical protein